jgi:hypothetical protein
MSPVALQTCFAVRCQEQTRPQEGLPPDTPGALLGTLEGLDSEALMQVCSDAVEMRCPLVQSLASEKSRRLVVVQERASWRQSVTGIRRSRALYFLVVEYAGTSTFSPLQLFGS